MSSGGEGRAAASGPLRDAVGLLARGASALGGAAFACALVLSAMCKPSKVLGFLDFTNEDWGWDPTLAFVMGGGLLVTVPAYHMLGLRDKTPSGPHARRPGTYLSNGEWARRPVDRNAILGGILFGLGWGLAGLCPGPGIVTCGAALAPPEDGGGGIVLSTFFASGGVWTVCMFSAKHGLDWLRRGGHGPCQISPMTSGNTCPVSGEPQGTKEGEATKIVVKPPNERKKEEICPSPVEYGAVNPESNSANASCV